MSNERFDAGHELHWEPWASNNIWASAGGPQPLFAFSPGTPGPDFLRVDYLSVVLQFAYADINAAAVINMSRLDGIPGNVVLLTATSGPVTIDSHLYATTQLAQPFIITQQFFMTVELHTTALFAGTAHATIGTSAAYKLPH